MKKSYKSIEIIALAQEMKVQGTPPVYKRVRPELYDLLMEHAGKPRGNEIDPKRFGSWLRGLRGQNHGGYRIMVSLESDEGNRWKLEEV
jgi:hypothetical protein